MEQRTARRAASELAILRVRRVAHRARPSIELGENARAEKEHQSHGAGLEFLNEDAKDREADSRERQDNTRSKQHSRHRAKLLDLVADIRHYGAAIRPNYSHSCADLSATRVECPQPPTRMAARCDRENVAGVKSHESVVRDCGWQRTVAYWPRDSFHL